MESTRSVTRGLKALVIGVTSPETRPSRRSLSNKLLPVAILGMCSWGCTLTSDSPDSGAKSSSGGAMGSGGVEGSGGVADTGGQPGTGGSGGETSAGSGGTPDSGGSPGSGGVTSDGGTTGRGGQSGSGDTGGARSTGGRSGSGGAAGSSGATGSGGRRGSGGAAGSGGETGRGGATGSGGATGPGGATGSGGRSGTGGAGTGGATGTGGSTSKPKGPCDIYLEIDKQPCVAAHSTVRLLLSTYTGPLYQIRSGGSKSGTGGTTTDIGFTADGYADSAAADAACGSASSCTISKIYDQSGKGNHLTVAPAGGAKTTPDNEADAKGVSTTLNGHKVYGEHGPAGVGYRNNKPSGTATGDNAETEYAIFGGDYYNNQCCFDYGNMETNSRDNGEGTMEAIYWGNCTIWGRGGGSGPWVMGDLENGLWAGNTSPYNNNPSITGYKFVSAFLKGDAAGKNHWVIKHGNAQSGTLTKGFDGQRPSSRYNPMRKEGAIGLNTGGDNSNSGIGNFFEGAMTAHFSSDAADDAVQANIVAAGYGK
jgi:hypothetical protein